MAKKQISPDDFFGTGNSSTEEQNETYTYSSNGKKKKGLMAILSVVMATVMTLTGISFWTKNKDKEVVPEEPSTAASILEGDDTPEQTDIQVEDSKYVICNAKNVPENVKNDYDFDRLCKYYNGTLTKNDFEDMTDDEILGWIGNCSSILINYFSQNIGPYTNAMGDLVKDGSYSEEDYKFDATYGSSTISTNQRENSLIKGEYLEEQDKTTNELLSSIDSGDANGCQKACNDMYSLLKETVSQQDLSINEKTVFVTKVKVLFPCMSIYYPENSEEYKYITSTFTKYDASSFSSIEMNLDIGIAPNADCTKNDNTYDGYNKNDLNQARNNSGNSNNDKNNTTKVYKGGQKRSKGTKEQVNEPTTKTESKPAVTKPVESTTESKKGNEVVSESTVTEPWDGKILEENVIQPGTYNSGNILYYDPETKSLYDDQDYSFTR